MDPVIFFLPADLPMQINLGMFEANGRCGYLKKPSCMTSENRSFDPFADTPLDGIVPGSLTIQVLHKQHNYTEIVYYRMFALFAISDTVWPILERETRWHVRGGGHVWPSLRHNQEEVEDQSSA